MGSLDRIDILFKDSCCFIEWGARKNYPLQKRGHARWSAVTEPPNYMKLSKKIILKADDLANLSPYNPVVREITTDFKLVHITAKIVLSLAVTIISYIKVCIIEYIGV
jgi:hypothetical protein